MNHSNLTDFAASMTEQELLAGESRHQEAEPSRKLAMAAGLLKSSDELKHAWETDPELFLAALQGAVAAYEDYKNVEELLVGALTRLISVVDADSTVVDRAMEIFRMHDGVTDQKVGGRNLIPS
ncbi:MAG: hypothetical protein HQ498_04485 [Pseudohongiella sp.]|nr:hypothetical protein [Pseudohongiella sp.]